MQLQLQFKRERVTQYTMKKFLLHPSRADILTGYGNHIQSLFLLKLMNIKIKWWCMLNNLWAERVLLLLLSVWVEEKIGRMPRMWKLYLTTH